MQLTYDTLASILTNIIASGAIFDAGNVYAAPYVSIVDRGVLTTLDDVDLGGGVLGDPFPLYAWDSLYEVDGDPNSGSTWNVWAGNLLTAPMVVAGFALTDGPSPSVLHGWLPLANPLPMQSVLKRLSFIFRLSVPRAARWSACQVITPDGVQRGL